MTRTLMLSLVVQTVVACGGPMGFSVDPSIGLTDSYLWDDATVTNATRGVVWQRRHAAAMMNWAAAGAYCSSAGLRLPTHDELVALGNWGHAHVGEANQAFPASDSNQFWSGYWSSSRAQGGMVWGVDFSGMIQDSIGIPVVDCALPPDTKTMLVRCVR